MNNESYIKITLSNLAALLARANVLVIMNNKTVLLKINRLAHSATLNT
jgi:hypothetical protein